MITVNGKTMTVAEAMQEISVSSGSDVQIRRKGEAMTPTDEAKRLAEMIDEAIQLSFDFYAIADFSPKSSEKFRANIISRLTPAIDSAIEAKVKEMLPGHKTEI